MKKTCKVCKKKFEGHNRSIRCPDCQKEYRRTSERDRKRKQMPNYEMNQWKKKRKKICIGHKKHTIGCLPLGAINPRRYSVRYNGKHNIYVDAHVAASTGWVKTKGGEFEEIIPITPSPERIEEWERKFDKIRQCKTPKEEEGRWIGEYLSKCGNLLPISEEGKKKKRVSKCGNLLPNNEEK